LKPTRAEEGPDAYLELIVKKGSVTIKNDFTEYPPMGPSTVFDWDKAKGPDRGPKPLPQLPEYWEQRVQPRRDARDGPEMDRALDALFNKMTANAPAGAMIAEALDAAEGWPGRFLAVLCFGAIDDIDYLADGLANERNIEVRDAAIEAVRQWLGRGPGQRDRLRKVLTEGKKYTTSETDTILYLLRIPSGEDMRERDTFAIPVDELNNDKLAIRHLAFWHLVRLCNKEMRENKLMYDPTDPPERRELNQKKWQKALQEGKLMPEQLRGVQGKQ
jgi:hypothetical protein